MQQADVSVKNIIGGIHDLPPEALFEVANFILFIRQKWMKSNLSAPGKNTGSQELAGELLALGKRCAALPLLDKRPGEQILGYNAQGLPE